MLSSAEHYTPPCRRDSALPAQLVPRPPACLPELLHRLSMRPKQLPPRAPVVAGRMTGVAAGTPVTIQMRALAGGDQPLVLYQGHRDGPWGCCAALWPLARTSSPPKPRALGVHRRAIPSGWKARPPRGSTARRPWRSTRATWTFSSARPTAPYAHQEGSCRTLRCRGFLGETLRRSG